MTENQHKIQSPAILIAALLFPRHTHVGQLIDGDPHEIVYTEKDVIDLLLRLGYPKPDFDNLKEGDIAELHKLPVIDKDGLLRFSNTPMMQLRKFIENEAQFHSDGQTVHSGNQEMKKGMVHSCKQMLAVLENHYLEIEAGYLKVNCSPQAK